MWRGPLSEFLTPFERNQPLAISHVRKAVAHGEVSRRVPRSDSACLTTPTWMATIAHRSDDIRLVASTSVVIHKSAKKPATQQPPKRRPAECQAAGRAPVSAQRNPSMTPAMGSTHKASAIFPRPENLGIRPVKQTSRTAPGRHERSEHPVQRIQGGEPQSDAQSGQDRQQREGRQPMTARVAL